ncbi:NAD(P)-binding protein [Aspergillus avenaceus]|uniref:NAD(P)-binding protein n=1 Tax=Aspergillus avenaceus TaxID=36643 RepID=A0A5N6U594_ASPAV|nr:NAD(P)-binding protein [Aspergillus avenaceus]
MRIAILPASPKTAQAAIRALFSTTVSLYVKGIYRDPSRAPVEFLSDSRFEAVQGDLSDSKSLDLSDLDAVLVVTPPMFHGDMLKTAKEISENVRKAIAIGSVKRVVYVSSMGAELSSGTGEIMTNHIAEEVLKGAAREVVFVRCAYFMENWESAVQTVQSEQPFFYSTVTPLDFVFDMIAVNDIGRICATHLLAPEIPSTPYILEAHGPRSYSVLDIQKGFSDVAGQKVEVKEVGQRDLPEFFGQFLPESVVDGYVEMTRSFLPGGVIARGRDYDPGVPVYQGETELWEVLNRMYGQSG